MSAASGRFVWFNLMTSDVDGAKPFYADIVGWTATKAPGSDYEMWRAGDTNVGGIRTLSSDARNSGMAPHWLAYVATDNVDATVKRAERQGGRTLVPGTDIPNIGRYAVLADPQGATFAVFSSSPETTPPETKAPGHFGWAELNTIDWKSAWKFYSGLFGWQHTTSMDMGPEYGEYFMFGADPRNAMGGMSNAATKMRMPPHWLHYVNVKNADQTAEKIARKGGKVLNGPMDVPGGGRIAQCVDPQGAKFAVFSPPQ
jgi:predicted enzyme related to lactoylglutathione lyase